MKKVILLAIAVVSMSLVAEVNAQLTAGTMTAIRPKRECKLPNVHTDINNTLNGNGNKEHAIVVTSRGIYDKYELVIRKINGNARATVSVFIDGVKNRDIEFIGTTPTASETIVLDNMTGKKVTIRVKNHSALDRFIYRVSASSISNTLLGDLFNSKIHKFTGDGSSLGMTQSCNGKGTIELTRVGGTSGAEIVVQKYGGEIIATENMAPNETSKRIVLNNLSQDGSNSITIRNISTGQFIRLRVNAWHN